MAVRTLRVLPHAAFRLTERAVNTIPIRYTKRWRVRNPTVKARRFEKGVQHRFDHVVFWTLTYPAFCLVALFFIIPLRLTRRFVLVGDQKWSARSILAPNHKDHIYEPMLFMSIGLWQSLRHPYKMMPWVVVDSQNYNRWYWGFIRQRFIFLPRNPKTIDDMRKVQEAIRKFEMIIRKGGRGIIFDEGGRTSSALRENEGPRHVTRKGNVMRQLKGGLARVACRSGATISVAWIDGSDRFHPRDTLLPRPWHRVTVMWAGELKIEKVRGTKKVTRQKEAEVTERATGMLLVAADRFDSRGSG